MPRCNALQGIKIIYMLFGLLCIVNSISEGFYLFLFCFAFFFSLFILFLFIFLLFFFPL